MRYSILVALFVIQCALGDTCADYACTHGSLKSNPSQITCAGSPCDADECCDPNCAGFTGCATGETTYNATHSCASLTCTTSECCYAAGTCSALTCASGSAYKANYANITCWGTTCTQSECCNVGGCYPPCDRHGNCTNGVCSCNQGYTGDGVTCSGSCDLCWNGGTFLWTPDLSTAPDCVSCKSFITGSVASAGSEEAAGQLAVSNPACQKCCITQGINAEIPCTGPWWNDIPNPTTNLVKQTLGLINATGACGYYLFINSSCGCNNMIMDTSETDIDCGGQQCGACANGLACKAGADCKSGSCSGGKCQSKGKSTLKAGIGAFVAILSVLFLLAGALVYMWWWKDLIAAEIGSSSGPASKRPLEMAVIKSGDASGPLIHEEKELPRKDEHEPLADPDADVDHHHVSHQAIASPSAGEAPGAGRNETTHDDDVYVS